MGHAHRNRHGGERVLRQGERDREVVVVGVLVAGAREAARADQ
jgi:hypothetical protein